MKRAMDDRAALIITFTYMTTIVLVIASDAFIVGSALAHAFGEPAWVASFFIVGLLAVAVVCNLRGITVAGLLQDPATSVVVLATLAVALLALARSGHGCTRRFAPLHGHGGGDFLRGDRARRLPLQRVRVGDDHRRRGAPARVVQPGHAHRLGILCVVCAMATVAMSHTLTHARAHVGLSPALSRHRRVRPFRAVGHGRPSPRSPR